MEISLDQPSDKNLIKSYEPGKIVVNDLTIEENLILSPDTIIRPWIIETIKDLTEEHLESILVFQPQIIILGTGHEQIFPKQKILKICLEKNIGVEVMHTQAACRTFNILVAEDRNVVSGLLLK